MLHFSMTKEKAATIKLLFAFNAALSIPSTLFHYACP